jgi:Tudor domain
LENVSSSSSSTKYLRLSFDNSREESLAENLEENLEHNSIINVSNEANLAENLAENLEHNSIINVSNEANLEENLAENLEHKNILDVSNEAEPNESLQPDDDQDDESSMDSANSRDFMNPFSLRTSTPLIPDDVPNIEAFLSEIEASFYFTGQEEEASMNQEWQELEKPQEFREISIDEDLCSNYQLNERIQSSAEIRIKRYLQDQNKMRLEYPSYLSSGSGQHQAQDTFELGSIDSQSFQKSANTTFRQIFLDQFNAIQPDDDLFLVRYPDVVQDPNLKLEPQEVTKNSFAVFITEFFSPNHFWFHYEHKAEDLMKKLKEDYEKLKDDELVFSDSNIKSGLLVAAYTYNLWHRAMVIELISASDTEQSKVRLLFVDYGTIEDVRKTKIKYLFKEFLAFPRYGQRGRLVNLKPTLDKRMWSEQQVTRILDAFLNKEMMAEVVKRDEDNNMYELKITLTESKRQIDMRDWIIEHGLAEGIEADSTLPSDYQLTFTMLESGICEF